MLCPSRALSNAVRHAHAIQLFGRRYHPYFLAFDAAMLLGLSIGIAFGARFGGVTPLGWVGVFALESALYPAFLRLKRKVLHISSRSFLQDTLSFLLPTYALASLAMGHPLGASLDAVGIMLPLVLGTIRIGCFLGGCCYGRASSAGVHYPRSIFRVTVTGLRVFTPGPNPKRRVLPIQLMETAVCFLLLVALWSRLERGAALDGSTLWLFLVGYCAWRLVAEPLRGTRHRPKWGPLSQAQWISFAVMPIATLLFVMR